MISQNAVFENFLSFERNPLHRLQSILAAKPQNSQKSSFENSDRFGFALASAWDMATSPPVPPLTDDERAALMLEVRRAGEPSAIRRLGVPRQTLARAIAGLSLRAGTILVIREALARTTKAA